MDLIKNWKLHLLALIVVIVAESIGMHRFGLVVLLPLLYALVLGGILSFPKFGILKFSEMDRAAKFMPIAMLVLLTKIGLGIGPNLEMLLNSGWALIMQEFGHFFGTLIFGLPVALLLGMKREAIGACYSIDREPNVAIIGEKYGLDSPEGRGVMGMYICGTVFGALWISILAGVVAGLDIFHPHSLAMGAGHRLGLDDGRRHGLDHRRLPRSRRNRRRLRGRRQPDDLGTRHLLRALHLAARHGQDLRTRNRRQARRLRDLNTPHRPPVTRKVHHERHCRPS